MWAAHSTASQLERIARGHDRATRNRAVEDQRVVKWRFDDDGTFVLQARLTPQEGELFLAALNTPATPSKTRHKTIPRNRRRGRPRPTH